MGKKERAFISRVKTAEEIRAIKKAVDITARIFRELESPFGRSERDFAGEIKGRIAAHGCRPAFRPIVASGSTVIHHKPGSRTIRENNPLIVDLGVRYKGYCSDVTRMHVPKGRAERKICSFVSGIQKKAINRVRPGIELKELQGIYKKTMALKRYKVRHGIGHGIGRHVHERIKGGLKAGMVLTIEPGVYIRNLGGFRVEDMVLVKKSGCEVLSRKCPALLAW
jgi:Xaa-Pro aminopeptidase